MQKKQLFRNKELVCNIISLTDDIPLEIQNITKVNLQSLKGDNILHTVEDEKSPDYLVNIILADSSQSNYQCIWKFLNTNCDLELPSYYKCAQKRSKIEPFVINNNNNYN